MSGDDNHIWQRYIIQRVSTRPKEGKKLMKTVGTKITITIYSDLSFEFYEFSSYTCMLYIIIPINNQNVSFGI